VRGNIERSSGSNGQEVPIGGSVTFEVLERTIHPDYEFAGWERWNVPDTWNGTTLADLDALVGVATPTDIPASVNPYTPTPLTANTVIVALFRRKMVDTVSGIELRNRINSAFPVSDPQLRIGIDSSDHVIATVIPSNAVNTDVVWRIEGDINSPHNLPLASPTSLPNHRYVELPERHREFSPFEWKVVLVPDSVVVAVPRSGGGYTYTVNVWGSAGCSGFYPWKSSKRGNSERKIRY
jgi:hypothetical protein